MVTWWQAGNESTFSELRNWQSQQNHWSYWNPTVNIKKPCFLYIKTTTTYHEVHWARPRTRRPIRLDKHIDLSLIHNFREARQSPSITRRPSYILQFEHYSENLSDGLLRILDTSANMESDTVEIVGLLWATRVDGCRVGEFFGLEQKKKG